MAATEPTDEQLRDAWRTLADPSWGSFDDARVAALHWARVRLHASLRARGIHPDANAPSEAAPPPAPQAPAPREAHAWRPSHYQQPVGLDRKRLAAGERDDD